MDCEHQPPKVEATVSHKNSVFTSCFSPDQTKLCSAGGDKKVILTSMKNFENQKVFTGHNGPIRGSDFSSNGKFLATGSVNGVRIWDVESENGNSTKVEVLSVILCVRYFHKDSSKVISSGCDKTIKIWDIERKKEISTLKGCEGNVVSVDILPDNQTIVSGDSWNNLRIWDFRSGKCVKILNHHKHWVYSVQFHPNTFSLASGSYDQTVKIFDFRTFQLLQNYQEHSYWVRSICFHPSGKFLVSGSLDKTIKIFDLSQKKVLFTLNNSNAVWSVKFSPDGKYFVSGGVDRKVLLWNFPRGRNILRKDNFDEEERVRYLIEQDFIGISGDDDDCCEHNILVIRIDDICTLHSYKFFFL